ncbi:ABC transporter ATP-binding protein [Aeromicrobium choanae]|uniref:Peptide/nickel transport system ATP-binding protein n=1 Tax=Aeromicrobium choanae TaxID=1736691 RepID=A0A1T4YUD3_9ACTN|nr:ABC transporter ATP-binding protein [Aeromicrobium choanae]SKB05372.1 peptide/nickel transport system ATP-binding protein [Aeromicrobium choanae]
MSLLTVEGLQVHFGHEGSQVQALYDVDLTIEPGEIVGLVGESGSGKTVTSLALMGLLDPRSSRIEGRAVLDGKPLWRGKGEKRTPRRELPMAMIFQEPMTALDPVFTVGSQLVETLRIRRGMGKAEARTESLSLLEAVGISDPKARMKAYPHELSGGMRQRVMIAIALACDPKLLIADEPTTAVDVTIQAQLLDLIKDLAKERGMAVLFVTHDLGVVSETCDRMITMYAGRIVERGPVAEVLASPGHPYTAGLLAALPSPESRGGRLATIPGRVPPPGLTIPGCVFESRCPYAQPECSVPQELLPLTPTREVRCIRSNELDFEGVAP